MANKYQTIYSVINLIYWSSKVFGIAPFVRDKERYASTIKVNRKGALSLLITLVVSATMLFSFVWLIYIRSEQGFFNQVNTILYIICALRILSGVITVFVLFFSQEALLHSYKQLQAFDNRKRLLEKPHYTNYFIATLLFICFIFLLVFGIEGVYCYFLNESFSILFCDLLSNGLQLLIHLYAILYFELYVILLTNGFKFIKLTARKLNEAYKEPNQEQKLLVNTIKSISFMYDDLYKGAGAINQVFSIPLFLLISLNFLEVLLGLYLMQDQNTRNIRLIFWTIFYTLQQFFILIPPGLAENQSKEISKYLSELELLINEELSTERNHFMLRMLHQTTSFSACGCFPISVSSIIGQFSISISFLLFMFQIVK